MKHIEEGEQILLFEFLEKAQPFIYQMAFAVPNGGYRNPREAQRMKWAGVKKGVPDIFIAIPTSEHHGLFIELKRPIVKGESKPNITKEQIIWIQNLNEQGYRAIVCYGFDEALKEIKSHYKIVQKTYNFGSV